MSSTQGIRYCSYCLILISYEKVILCAKCGHRAYCSKPCQTKDWETPTSAGTGGQQSQGHKNWCDLRCCEEDIDWKVAPVEGKGLIALKPIPAKSRILVDACQLSPDAHPATKDVLPEGETNLQEKCYLNAVGGGELCLRISRANHDCLPNAAQFHCDTFKVNVFGSLKASLK